jgi:hypothetical protein
VEKVRNTKRRGRVVVQSARFAGCVAVFNSNSPHVIMQKIISIFKNILPCPSYFNARCPPGDPGDRRTSQGGVKFRIPFFEPNGIKAAALPLSSKQGSLAMSRSSLSPPMPQQNIGRTSPTSERLLQESDLFY